MKGGPQGHRKEVSWPAVYHLFPHLLRERKRWLIDGGLRLTSFLFHHRMIFACFVSFKETKGKQAEDRWWKDQENWFAVNITSLRWWASCSVLQDLAIVIRLVINVDSYFPDLSGKSSFQQSYFYCGQSFSFLFVFDWPHEIEDCWWNEEILTADKRKLGRECPDGIIWPVQSELSLVSFDRCVFFFFIWSVWWISCKLDASIKKKEKDTIVRDERKRIYWWLFLPAAVSLSLFFILSAAGRAINNFTFPFCPCLIQLLKERAITGQPKAVALATEARTFPLPFSFFIWRENESCLTIDC